MYVELFLLDNAVMDFLLLRLAAALCGRRVKAGRLALFALLGAGYAMGAVFFSWLCCVPAKLAAGLLLSLALPGAGGRERLVNAGAVFAASFAAGGLASALALLGGGSVQGGAVLAGVPLRVMLYAAAGVCLLPNLVRALDRLRLRQKSALRLTIRAGGMQLELPAMLDSGNLLHDPLSGLPLVVAYAPPLLPYAYGEIPARTAAGNGMLRLCRAELLLDGKASCALLALCETPLYQTCALVPPAALPPQQEKEKEDMIC